MDFADDALGNFEAILKQTDFAEELHILQVGSWQFLRRKQMLLELKGVYAGLWHRALCRSFPDHADEIFHLFLERHAAAHPDRKGAQFRERAAQYKDMFSITGDQNFSMVSEHLLSFSNTNEQERKSIALRLTLSLRSTYTMIFDRLI